MALTRSDRTLASLLRSPALAVVAAYMVRIALLWVTNQAEGVHARFQVLGLEAGRVAWSLATGKGFFGPFPGYEAVTAWLAPVYPFLWSIGFRLLHLNPSAGILIGQTMNCAFSAATCWPIYSIGKKIFGERVGLASAWLWVFLPNAILMPLEWTWDQSLAAFVLALIVCATLGLRESASSLSWTGYGLLWALAALVNPTLCCLLPFLLGWLIFLRRKSGWVSLALCARAMFVFLLALMPWTIRNYYTVGGWFFVKSNFGLELWLGNNPSVKENYSPELHPLNNFSERMRLILDGEANYNREKLHKAVGFIEAQPRVFLKNSFDRVLDNWTSVNDSRVDGWILALHLSRADIWFYSAFSVLSFAGLILALRAHLMDALPLAMCLLLFPIPYYITHTALRYRHPIDPFMAIFTVYAIARLCSALLARPIWKVLPAEE